MHNLDRSLLTGKLLELTAQLFVWLQAWGYSHSCCILGTPLKV